MTVQKSDPLNANGVPLPAAEAQVLKNGLPSTLPDIDVWPRPILLLQDEADPLLALTPHNHPRKNVKKTA